MLDAICLLVIVLKSIHCDAANVSNNNNSSKIYPNHRMDYSAEDASDNPKYSNHNIYQTSSTSSNHSPRGASAAQESVLRPQVAVQIFTSPTQQQNSTTSSSYRAPNGTRAASTRLHDNYLNQNQLFKLQHDYQTASSISSPVELWHHFEPPGVSQKQKAHNDDHQRQPAPEASSSFTLAGPVINAIITVPSTSTSNQQQQPSSGGFSDTSPPEDGYVSQAAPASSHEEQLAQNISAANVERAISHLLDSQSSGNLEFNMNLQGDEIVINPAGKRASSMFSTSLPPMSSSGQLDSESSRQNLALSDLMDTSENFSNNNNKQQAAMQANMSKPLQVSRRSLATRLIKPPGRHKSGANARLARVAMSPRPRDYDDDGPDEADSNNVDSFEGELGGQDDDGDEPEYDSDDRPPASSLGRSSLEQDQISMAAANLRRQQSDDRPGRFKSSARSRRADQNDEDQNYGPDEESARRPNSKSSNGKRSSQQTRPSQPFQRQKHFKSSTRRQRAYEHDDQAPQTRSSSSQSRNKRRGESSSRLDQQELDKSQPSVVIKGEDLKRFEQLLESLRSLSMVNLNSGGSGSKKRHSKSSSELGNQDQSNEMDNNEQDPTRPSAAQQQRLHDTPPGNSRSSSALSDCLKRVRQLQQQQQAEAGNKRPLTRAGGDSTSEQSSSDAGQADSVAVSEGNSDDLNSDGGQVGQNLELEEQLDASNLINTHQSSLFSSTSSANRTTSRPPPAGLTSSLTSGFATASMGPSQPKALFVRKTILQSYYDDLTQPQQQTGSDRLLMGALSDDEAPVLSAIQRDESSRDRDANEAGQSPKPSSTFDIQDVHESSGNQNSNNDMQQDRNSAKKANLNGNQNPYIDYDRLDDREFFRGSESKQKSRVVAGPLTPASKLFGSPASSS